MKKITSTETIEFMVSGIKGTPTENTVVINDKGVIVSDSDAAIIASRFGGLITITNADVKAVKAAAKEALEDEKETDPKGDEDAPEEEGEKSKK